MSSMSDEERLARMRKVWVAEGPSGFEIATARRRYLQRTRPLPMYKLVLDMGWGVALATASLFALDHWSDDAPSNQELATVPSAGGEQVAAVANDERAAEVQPRGADVVEAAQVPPSIVAPRIERDGIATVAVPGVSYHVLPGQQVTVLLGERRTVVRGPQLIEFTFEADRASGFRMHLSNPADVAPSAYGETPGDQSGRAGRSTGSAGGVGSKAVRGAEDSAAARARGLSAWSRAADAMRRGDTREAERALTELSQEKAAHGADSAALALAQLWLANGEVERARPVLKRLSRSADSRVVRRRARELLVSPSK